MLNRFKRTTNNLKKIYNRHKLSKAKTETLNAMGVKIILETHSDYEKYREARNKFFMLSDKNKLHFIQKYLEINNR